MSLTPHSLLTQLFELPQVLAQFIASVGKSAPGDGLTYRPVGYLQQIEETGHLGQFKQQQYLFVLG